LGELKAYLLYLLDVSASYFILCWKKKWGGAKLGKRFFTFEQENDREFMKINPKILK
jgi:hypothetical protein